MKIIIKAKNLELTEGLEDFIEKKFLGLKRFINILKKNEPAQKTLAEVFVEIEKETSHHRKGNVFVAEAQIVLPNKSLMARATSDDMLKAIVKCKDELRQMIEKYKLKNIEKNRRQRKKLKKEVVI